MAQNEIEIRFKVTDDGSLKMIGQQAKSAAKDTDKLANSRNNYNRGEKGVAGATNNSTRSFSKMRDSITGSGGLVAAYATLAANVFALSAVFNTLRRAAEVEQLKAGLTALGTVSGLAMQSLSKGLVEATGGALNLEQAMRATAQVTSAGLDPSTLNEFGEAARNISIALGRDVSDSFDRLTRGVTKLEPELLDELGLFVRVDEATQKYATSVNKAVGDLTNFERRLAFSNEALEQATDKFGDIGDSVDVNAYAKLSAAVADLSKNILETVNVALVPFVELLSANPNALFATIGIFGGRVLAGAVANFGTFGAAAEKAGIRAKALGVKVADTVGKLNTTARGMKNLSAALKAGTADAALFKGGFDSVTKSIAYYDRALAAGTVTQAAHGERMRANTTITHQFLQAKIALTLASANENAQNALVLLQQGEYRKALIATKDAIKLAAKALAESTFRLTENATVSTIVAIKEKVLTAVTTQLGAAYIFVSGVISTLTTKLLAYATVQKVLTFLHATGSRAVLIFGTAARVAAGGVAFLGSAILIALPIISLLALAFTLGGDAVEWFKKQFRSDEENQLVEDLKEADTLLGELSNSAIETSRAYDGQQSKIKSLTDLYSSLSNQLNTASGKYIELSRNATFDDGKRAEFLNKLLKDNVFLQEAVAKEAKIEGLERVKNISQLQAAGISLEKAVDLTEEGLENARSLSEAYSEVSKAIEEGKQAADEFINALTPKTSLDALSTTFGSIVNAIETAQEEANSTSAVISDLLAERLTDNQKLTLGVDTTNVAAEITKIESQIATLNKEYTALHIGGLSSPEDVNRVVEIANLTKKLNDKKKELQKRESGITDSLIERAKLTNRLIKDAQREEQTSKINLTIAKAELNVEKEKNQKTKESLEEQQKLRDNIQRTIMNSVIEEMGIYEQIRDTLLEVEQTAEVKQLILFLNGKIGDLEEKGLLAQEKILTIAEKAVEQAQLILSNTKLRIDAEKQILAHQERSVALLEKEFSNRKKVRDAVLQTRAALQNREVTSEEKLKTEPGSGRSRSVEETKELDDLLRTAANLSKQAAIDAGASVKEATAISTAITASTGTQLADEIEIEIKKGDIRAEKIRLEYDLLGAQYGLLAAQIEVYKEQGSISEAAAERLTNSVKGITANLDDQEGRALSANQQETTANVVGMASSSIEERVRVEEERRIEVRDAMIQQGERMIAQGRQLEGLQKKRDAFETERLVLAQRVAELQKERGENEPPSQALMQAEAALQENINAQLQIRQAQISALIEKVKEISGGNLPGLENLSLQTTPQSVAEVPGAERGTPTEGTSATGADPALTMTERVGQIRETALEMTTILGELGPQGEAMQMALSGAMALADTFATAFDSIGEGGLSMQEGLQAAGSVVSALGAMQQAQAKNAVAAVDQQIEAEKKRDGKSKESLAKIAALEKKKESIERKAFEQKKKAQMASVIISTASAIMKEAEKGIPASLPGIAMAAALGAAQLSIISSQTYQGGGSSVPSTPSKISVGQRENTVDLARANNASGELAYARGESGVGSGMTSFTPTPAFTGMKYRANGGNTAFMVGEQGPELFMPDRPGTIMPSDETEQMSSAPINVNFSIQALDSQSVQDMLLVQRANIIGMIREAANGSGEAFLESVNIDADQYQMVER